MRSGIKKHYQELDLFVRAANLGWKEICKHNDFPTLDKLEPHEKHRALLARIGRAFETRFRKIGPAGKVPLLTLPNWRTTSRAQLRQLHYYALVRRIFDSLGFLTQTISVPCRGTSMVPLALEVDIADDGSVVRVRDPFEDFVSELSGCDLRRLEFAPRAEGTSSLGALIRKHATGDVRIESASVASGRKRMNTRRIGSSEDARAFRPFDTEEID